MTPGDFDTVRSIYDALARRDLEAIHAALTCDVLIEQPEILPWGGRYQGLDGFDSFIAALLRRLRPELSAGQLIDSGEHIVRIGRNRGTVVANDRDYDIAEVHVWGLRDGKVSSLTVYPDTADLTAALTAP